MSIKKLMTTEIESYQVFMCFNVCMLTHVFFGCGIVKFSLAQLDTLKKTCEEPMSRKLGLGKSFPRDLSCARKTALGSGLIDPQTALDMLEIKIYVGNKRGEDELGHI